MKVPIVVQHDDGHYLARCADPVRAEARGESRFEAVSRLADVLRARLGSDAETLPLDVTPDRPWLASAGSLPDDEQTRAWIAEMAELRSREDPVPDRPEDGGSPPALPVPTPPAAEARP